MRRPRTRRERAVGFAGSSLSPRVQARADLTPCTPPRRPLEVDRAARKTGGSGRHGGDGGCFHRLDRRRRTSALQPSLRESIRGVRTCARYPSVANGMPNGGPELNFSSPSGRPASGLTVEVLAPPGESFPSPLVKNASYASAELTYRAGKSSPWEWRVREVFSNEMAGVIESPNGILAAPGVPPADVGSSSTSAHVESGAILFLTSPRRHQSLRKHGSNRRRWRLGPRTRADQVASGCFATLLVVENPCRLRRDDRRRAGVPSTVQTAQVGSNLAARSRLDVRAAFDGARDTPRVQGGTSSLGEKPASGAGVAGEVSGAHLRERRPRRRLEPNPDDAAQRRSAARDRGC